MEVSRFSTFTLNILDGESARVVSSEKEVIRVEFVDSSGTKVALDIPMKEVNTDYQNLLKWAAIDGNNIEEAD